jgi:hypothetical protein
LMTSNYILMIPVIVVNEIIHATHGIC